MRTRFLWAAISCLGVLTAAKAQEITPIYRIQGSGASSGYQGREVVTEGVVTLTLFGENQLNGFFIQDTVGDGDEATSDGIFVYGKEDVRQGDYVRLTAKVSEYSQRTELSGVKNLELLKKNTSIPFKRIAFPDGFDSEDAYESLEGMAVLIPHTMWLNATRSLTSDGIVELGSSRLRSPTDYNLPASEAYLQAVADNARNRLYLDDGSSSRNPSPCPWLDADGTCRTGQKVDSLFCVVDQVDKNYRVYAVYEPRFYGNERTAAPDESALGDYELKVCGFNIEMFFDESPLQRARIVNALDAIDADMFGLVEVGGGRKVIDSLVAALNRAKGKEVYDYVRWSGYETTSTYTLNHIVYKTDRLEPYDKYFMLNTVSPTNRKLIQAFREKEHDQVFIFSINHFKAKSGTGTGANADQGDGQGIYNQNRVQEAYAVLNQLNSLRYYYGTEKILVMGDLNALYREDPIRIFTDAGYEDQVHRFSENYTYCYDGQIQYLDYSLASPSMQPFVTGATVWHINADEPAFMDYEKDRDNNEGPYRSSDHEPVIVGLSFASVANRTLVSGALAVYPNPAKDRFYLQMQEAGKVEILTCGGLRLKSQSLPEGRNEIDVRDLRPGLYLVRIRAGKDSVKTVKLLLL